MKNFRKAWGIAVSGVLPAILFGATALKPASQVRPPTDLATVSGIVARDGSAEPLADVEVTLVLQGSRGGAGSQSVRTSTDGRFALDGINPGNYTLQIRKPGYFSPAISNTAYLVSFPLAVTSQQRTNIKLGLVSGGTIFGKVSDANGQALVNIPVSIVSQVFLPDGRPRVSTIDLSVTSTAGHPELALPAPRTNDKGEYRLYGLPPGTYYVRADIPNSIVLSQAAAVIRTSVSTANTTEAYYPDVNDMAFAGSVTVRSGTETNAGIVVRPHVALTISGKIVQSMPLSGGQNAGASVRPVSYQLYLIPRDVETLTYRNARELATAVMPPNATEAAFSISDVKPGSYWLIARTAKDMGRIPIDALRDNVENISVPIPPPAILRGKISVEGGTTLNLATLPLSIRMDYFETPMFSAKIAADGTFTIPDVPVGGYTLQAATLPENVYVASARQGSRNVILDGIRADSDSESIDIVVNAAGGDIEGTVKDATGKTSPALVTLIPQSSMHMTFSNRRVAADLSGHFKFGNLQPGDYRIYAWENIPVGEELNTPFMSMFGNLGTLLHIAANGHSNLELRVIPRDVTSR